MLSLAVTSVLFESVVLAIGCVSCSRVMHSVLLRTVLRTPMSFFDTTPLGRIMNRFSKDIDTVDVMIPQFIRLWLTSLVPVMATIIVISYSTPIFLAVAVPLAILYYLVQVSTSCNTVPTFNSCTECVDSPSRIHDRTPDCHPVSLSLMHG